MDFETPPSGTPSQPPPERPPGRARQRIQQRKQERASASSVEPRRSPSSQVTPSGGVKIPQVRLTAAQILPFTIVGAVLFVMLIVYILGRLRNEAPERPPNALWVGTEWTYETHDDQTVATWVNQLRVRQIGTVYAWLSWLQADDTWRGEDNFERVKAFVSQFKRLYPEAEIMAWIGVPADAGEGYRLDQPTLQTRVADFSRSAVTDFGFDGVFLNIEPVWTDDQNFLAVLRSVRAVLGEGDRLAAAIPPDWSPVGADIPKPPLIAPGTEWGLEYKQSVALLLDQIAIMAYNSGLSSPADYTQWMAYQVKAYAQALDALAADMATEIIVGIPTYDAELPGHDPAVENILAAAAGIRLGMQQSGEAARHVRGTAIYAGWTTDESEWAQFEQSWLRP